MVVCIGKVNRVCPNTDQRLTNGQQLILYNTPPPHTRHRLQLAHPINFNQSRQFPQFLANFRLFDQPPA